MQRVLPIVVSLVLVGGVATAGPLAASDGDGAPEPKFNPPKQYTLALGDSNTYGFRFSTFAAGLPPSAYRGYVDHLAERLRDLRPDLSVVNYGCPGESTRTFIAGPCLYPALGGTLHDHYEGSQLDAAAAFLRAHPGRVSPITLHLFGGDVNELIGACGGEADCVRREAPAAIALLAGRLDIILGRLRGVARDAEIIVVGGWRVGPPDDFDALFRSANGAVAAVASRHRAFFADLLPVFNPPGATERNTALCTLTLVCSEGDGHPSDAGHRAIADAVLEVSGYGRLGD